MSEKKSIRFIDSNYKELFRIPDGGMIKMSCGNGDVNYAVCRYLDDYHTEIDGQCFHICEFAERMEKCGIICSPSEKNEKAFELKGVTELEQPLFFSDSEQDVRTGCIGHLRGDFGKDGNEFYTTWFNHREEWKTTEFMEELDRVINYFRSDFEYPLLKNRAEMMLMCGFNADRTLQGRSDSYGFKVVTPKYSYYLRCFPHKGDYNFYCYCYDNRRLNLYLEQRKQRNAVKKEPERQDR